MLESLLKQPSSWEFLQNTDKPIILYGTGNGADMVLDELDMLSVKLTAVAASDGFVRKRAFRGFEVISITDAVKLYPDAVIALGFATCIPEVMTNIKELAKIHKVIMPVVPVFGDTFFNREYIEKHISELEYSRSFLYDEESKRVFDSMVYFQFSGKLEYLFSAESSRAEALTSILKLSDKEYMLDLGAYRGDTIQELRELTGGYSCITALEPDKKSFQKLLDYTQNMPNITALPYAVWSEKKTLTFSGGGGRQSTLKSDGNYKVSATDIDSLTEGLTVTYLKADVEGVEKEMLMGMTKLLAEQKPKLSIACYHRTEDLCTLIPQIHKANPQYKIHLRHHPYIPFWDTNLYCI